MNMLPQEFDYFNFLLDAVGSLIEWDGFRLLSDRKSKVVLSVHSLHSIPKFFFTPPAVAFLPPLELSIILF